MKKSGYVTSIIAVLLAFALGGTGCASKKYVSKQVNSVNQKLAQLEKQTNDRITWINNKEQTDIAQVNERLTATDQRVSATDQTVSGLDQKLSTTDQKVSEVASSVQETQGTAARAVEEANSKANEAATINLQLVEKADVMFAFNKTTLTPEAKATLDEIATKCRSMPRTVVELAGFTDRAGSKSYNLDLSRRRAWIVQRYLVEHEVSLRSIHLVGFGEEAPPAGLEPEGQVASAKDGKSGRDNLSRRVNIRVYGVADAGAASRSEQEP
jgi:OOP family OmpA-OmpF porin